LKITEAEKQKQIFESWDRVFLINNNVDIDWWDNIEYKSIQICLFLDDL
jgi:hypothetical protein